MSEVLCRWRVNELEYLWTDSSDPDERCWPVIFRSSSCVVHKDEEVESTIVTSRVIYVPISFFLQIGLLVILVIVTRFSRSYFLFKFQERKSNLKWRFPFVIPFVTKDVIRVNCDWPVLFGQRGSVWSPRTHSYPIQFRWTQPSQIPYECVSLPLQTIRSSKQVSKRVHTKLVNGTRSVVPFETLKLPYHLYSETVRGRNPRWPSFRRPIFRTDDVKAEPLKET